MQQVDATRLNETFRWRMRADGIVAATIITGNDKPLKLATVPYIQYYHWITRRLDASPRLVIVGYGGGDQYLNALIYTWAAHHGDSARAVIISKYNGRPPPNIRALARFALGESDMDLADILDEKIAKGRTVWLTGKGFPPDETDVQVIQEFIFG